MTRALPDTVESLLIRTDFSDDAGWRATVDAASQSWDLGGGVITGAHFLVVDDAAFDGLTLVELAEVVDGPPPYYVFLADADTIADPEHSILAVDTSGASADFPTFRVHPSQMPSVENNLSLANMDFESFSSAVGADGVFRGFGEPQSDRRALSKVALLDAIGGSKLSGETLAKYRAALERWSADEVDGAYSHEVRDHYYDIVKGEHELDMNVFAVGGAAVGFTLPARSGYCGVYVDADTLVPVAVLLRGDFSTPAPMRNWQRPTAQ
ncbi:DUF6924 domain-containing protein [Rhodococcoides kroppenstedtii]|uniref:DUF6924 domain-containing protein n=1 Tax=Rhodococcoides kroppenstedtii TaxID=293050 RepID=UPI001427A82C|nr:hypothetical protein [Rhodococcus kroppenstedtii]NIL82011.1 hypothetical protein [Rhodococcus kroppenstedtii]